VRNIYDRIDTLESSVALPPAELERISEMLGQIGTRLGSEQARPDRLLGLVDALNGRINEIEDKGDVLAGLKGDIGDLRDAVLRAIEPRFAAIEIQLGTLSETIAKRGEGGPGLPQVEAQLRQLVARMDQTGEQLADLAVLQMRAEERTNATPAPDFEALAEAAAQRAAAALAERLPEPQPLPDLEALAETVAGRTAEAVAQRLPDAAPLPDFAALAAAAATRAAAALAERLPEPQPLPDFEALTGAAATQAAEAVVRQIPAGPSRADLEAMAEAAATQAAESVVRQLPASPSAADLETMAERAAAQAFAALERHEPPPALPDLNALADLVAERTGEVLARRPQLPAAQLEVIADIVATRTSAAIARQEPPPPPPPSMLSEEGMAEIEARISRLVEGFLRARPPEGLPGVREGIGRVEDRLSQLEASLSRDAAERRAAAEAGRGAAAETDVAAAAEPEANREAVADAAVAESPAENKPVPPASAFVGPKDAMPRHPDVDAPLKEFGFPDLGPVRAALEARSGTQRPQGLTEQLTAEDALHFEAPPITPEMTAGAGRQRAGGSAPPAPPAFDPSAVVRPPRPESTLEGPFAPIAGPARQDEPVPASSRNTFIEAARRAAQRQGVQPPAGSDSLIGKALARFQPGAATDPEGPVTAPAAMADETPDSDHRARRKGKTSPAAAAAEPASVAEPADIAAPIVERRSVPRESFLVRHRKPILVAASLVAVSFMTLNLVMQRLSAGDAHPAAATVEGATPAHAPAPDPARPAGDMSAATKPSSVALPQPAPGPTLAAARAAVAGPEIAPARDPVVTGSIAPAEVMSYAAAPAATPMPPALAAATNAASGPLAWASPLITALAANAPSALESPVKVELPPEAVGPLDLRQSAADGDARAQFEVAAIYSEGRAVPQDFKQAAVWYERAAAQGFAPAQYRLGNLYENGKGVSKDYEQARLWYQRAAEAGNRMAMHNLAALYAGGQFGEQDFDAAAEWFQRAADRGMKDSQFNLGMLYARGLGVPQNLETSYKWFALAAATGDTEAAKARDNVARSLDAEAIKRVTAEVAGWKPTQVDLAANFAPIGTWEKDFNPGPSITTRSVVEKVQAALIRLGYDVGTPDGQMGPKTALAIKAFERGTGMTEVGAINPRLLAVLGSQPV
jgi:localization factor PodJL